MAGDPQAKARKAVRRTQADFEKAQDKLEALREARPKSFEDAQDAGLSTRDIEGTGTVVGVVSAGDNRTTCFASLLPDPEHPGTPSALTDPRLSPLDGLTLQP